MNKDNIKAIVYTSETGHTAQYAQLLSDRTEIPVFELKKAMKEVKEGSEIIYMGWLMAGHVKGYDKAIKLFSTKLVIGVGMARSGGQLEDITKANNISDGTKVFNLQGGFELEKLHGLYRFMMNAMKKTVAKQLMEKPDRTEEEDETLDIMMNGRNMVSDKELDPVVEWLTSQD